jgi:hypothetical protein
LKVNEENSRIQIRVHLPEAWIRGSGSVPKCHRSATLVQRNPFWFLGQGERQKHKNLGTAGLILIFLTEPMLSKEQECTPLRELDIAFIYFIYFISFQIKQGSPDSLWATKRMGNSEFAKKDP